MRILIVEDEPEMASVIKQALEAEGMVVDGAVSIAQAHAALRQGVHDLLLLDRQLPDGDGASLIAAARSSHPDLPIILLTGKSGVADKVQGLDLGADDYLSKPFAIEELMARLRAIGRRPAQVSIPTVSVGRLTFDFSAREARVDGLPVPLPRRQLLVLEALCLRAERTVVREWLIERVYGFDDDIQSNALDAHVSKLRRQLESVDAKVTIHVIRGVGYLLRAANHG
ncbi:response regulator transcription factor [Acidovorax cavernicola]|uniref:DNA-binding response regulator n=1 Tax=Acidovorax cavernicola TaxID=1675792 RepID=A0A9X8D7A9_9BURK|nr:response regulator transcription factor [Acidovorax cavernicola]RIX83182.1 DNA-binding response regulator [Acidovorax cavernicola]